MLLSTVLVSPVLQANAVTKGIEQDPPPIDLDIVGEEQVVDTGKPATGGTIGSGGNPFGSSGSGGSSSPGVGSGGSGNTGSGLNEARPPPSATKPDAGTSTECAEDARPNSCKQSKQCFDDSDCGFWERLGYVVYKLKNKDGKVLRTAPCEKGDKITDNYTLHTRDNI